MSRVFKHKLTHGSSFSSLCLWGTSVFTLTYYLKNSLFLKYYTNYTELIENDEPVSLSARLMNTISAAKEDVKTLTSEHTDIKPFIVPGLRPVHAGTIGTLAGGTIGLPIYFEFNNKEDVDGKIRKTDSFTDYNPDEEIHSCFLLSEKAKKYVIAREILCINSFQVYIESVIPICISGLINIICTNGVPVLNIYLIHPVGQCFFYTCLLALGLSFWRTTHSITKNYVESEIEDEIAALGLEYIEGAIEYYSKAQERASLKLELKDQNSRILNTLSEKLYPITSKRDLPLSYMLAFYKFKLNEYKENSKDTVGVPQGVEDE